MGPILTFVVDNFVPMTTGPSHLSDGELLAAIRHLANREHRSSADLVAHFIELDARRLYLGEGYASFFEYCRDGLHLSEDRACNYMAAARTARAFPAVLPMLEDGRLSLSTLRMLGPHLTEKNHAALLGESAFRSKRDVEEILARHFPRAAVAASVRRKPALEPLAANLYLFKATVDGETVGLFRRAQDLGSHAVPSRDAAETLKRALKTYVAELERKRFSATKNPRTKERRRDAASRDIPAAVERAVWTRDGGSCSHVGRGGRRCTSTTFLQYHHLRPWIAGGPASVPNITLRCQAHNLHEADRYFAPIRAAMGSIRPGADP